MPASAGRVRPSAEGARGSPSLVPPSTRSRVLFPPWERASRSWASASAKATGRFAQRYAARAHSCPDRRQGGSASHDGYAPRAPSRSRGRKRGAASGHVPRGGLRQPLSRPEWPRRRPDFSPLGRRGAMSRARRAALSGQHHWGCRRRRSPVHCHRLGSSARKRPHQTRPRWMRNRLRPARSRMAA
jgi:hypothetical protein